MEFDRNIKQATRELGDAINEAIEKSTRVAEAIENLRRNGFEPHLNLKLEIALQAILQNETQDDFDDSDFELTEDDLKILQRMKIKF